MTKIAVSRRSLLEVGACALAVAAGLPAATDLVWTGGSKANEEIIRRYYAAWGQKEWEPIDILLAENFTFTSPNNDDHISKSAFKARCWQSQIDFIDGSTLEKVFGSGNEAFVKYLCRTKNGKSFRNIEYYRFKDGKIESIECYFGGAGFPSAASTGKT